MARIDDKVIGVVGADANNLRDVDVGFPIGAVSMVVGVSGSGKTSLLSETLAREGNSRLKSFLGVDQGHLAPPTSSAFVGRMPATLHLGQRAFRASSRTTVGTASGLLSSLRRMFIRWSSPISERTGKAVLAPSVDTFKGWLLEHHRGEVVIWAIPLSFVANDGVEMARRLGKLGLTSVIVRSETDSPKRWEAGRRVALDKFKPLTTRSRHLVESKIGSVNLGKHSKAATEDLETILALAFEAGEGRVFVELVGAAEPGLDSRHHWVTPNDQQRYRAPSEHLLSFNAPEHEASGACPTCRGIGRCTTLDIDALVTDPTRSMHDGAFALWTPKNYKYVNIQHETIEGLRGLRKFDPDRPWSKLSAEARQLVLEGAGDELITDLEIGRRRKLSKPRLFRGFRAAIRDRVAKGGGGGERLAFLVGEGPCPTCQGSRWSAPASALSLGGYSIDSLLSSSIGDLVDVFAPQSSLSKALPKDARGHLKQIHDLAKSFVGVGLDHISGDRGMLEVSEGESRRMRLAATLDGRHRGLCLLLDEPARGLHDEDVDRLAVTLSALRSTHTLILNEHRRRLAVAADFLVELGPGAGPEGGAIVSAGKVPKNWWRSDSESTRVRVPVKPRGPKLRISGARINNLKGVNVSIPLGHLVCVAGVSGSGKSSFVRGVLVPALCEAFDTGSKPLDFDVRRGRWNSLSGTNHLTGLIALDQRSSTPNRRSTVATFLGLAEPLRRHYGRIPEAKVAGLDVSDFGLNAGKGRCNECRGIGELEETGHWVTCPSCGGMRFGPDALAVLDDGLCIAQVLDRSLSSLYDEPLPVFNQWSPLLRTIEDLGIGHLSIGRRLDTVSGGEYQRLRIARELCEREGERLIIVLDEPAAGLHRDDVARLLLALDKIVKGGHSVVIVEHNLELAAAADWIIEFGPGSGPRGGQLIAEGAATKLKRLNTPTGRMLRSTPTSSKPKRSHARPEAPIPPTEDEADSALRWLRRLLGEDLPPREHEVQSEGSRTAVVINEEMLEDRRMLEYGGLDREMARLLLECQSDGDSSGDVDALVDAWELQPKAELRIHPLLRELYVWGPKISLSATKSRHDLLLKHGLAWFDNDNPSKLRAGGGPLACNVTADRETRARLVVGALRLGGGYVELRKGAKVLSTLVRRQLDLKRGLVGPLSPSAHDFDRRASRGRCPCCAGRGLVPAYERKLIFRDIRKPVEARDNLTPGALSVIKGIHRNILLPFLRRMAKEDLWTQDRSFAKLDGDEHRLLLHGFWVRPGPGTFLRTPKSNPKEVASWLRWDGLFAHLRENLSRGPKQWQEQMLKSQRMSDCPFCAGLGLKRHISLFQLAGRSFDDWLANGTIAELYAALARLTPASERGEQRRDRLLKTLKPLSSRKLGGAKLRAPLAEGPWEILMPNVVAAFTDMDVLKSE